MQVLCTSISHAAKYSYSSTQQTLRGTFKVLGKVSWAAPSCHLNEQTDVSTAVRLFSISRNFLSFGGAGRFLGVGFLLFWFGVFWCLVVGFLWFCAWFLLLCFPKQSPNLQWLRLELLPVQLLYRSILTMLTVIFSGYIRIPTLDTAIQARY